VALIVWSLTQRSTRGAVRSDRRPTWHRSRLRRAASYPVRGARQPGRYRPHTAERDGADQADSGCPVTPAMRSILARTDLAEVPAVDAVWPLGNAERTSMLRRSRSLIVTKSNLCLPNLIFGRVVWTFQLCTNRTLQLCAYKSCWRPIEMSLCAPDRNVSIRASCYR
jgi:hypothetical protein